MKNKIKNLIIKMFQLIVLLTATVFITMVVAKSTESYAWSRANYSNQSGGALIWNPIGHHEIKSFLINADVFNSDKCFFCGQHGVPYANGGGTVNGNFDPEKEGGYALSRHQSPGTGQTRGDADVPTNTNGIFYVDAQGNVHKPDMNTINYVGHKDSKESPVGDTVTNWVYVAHNFSAHCNTSMVGWPSGKSHGQNGISDTGLAFILACFQGDGPRNDLYKNDPLQHTVWKWLGQYSGSTPYEAIAKEFQSYHSAAYQTEKAKIKFGTTTVAKDGSTVYAGTTINSNNTVYTVGPFTIDKYTRAKDYAGNVSNLGSHTIIEISKREYDVLPDSDKQEYVWDSTSKTYKSVNRVDNTISVAGTLQETLSRVNSQNVGDIIKIEAVLGKGTNETKTITVYDYFASSQYQGNLAPNPGDTMNFKFSASDLEGWDELKSLKVTYRRVHSQLEGTYYDGIQYWIRWYERPGSAKDSGENYKCTTCKHTGISESGASFKGQTHAYWCGSEGYCSHGWSSTHYACHNGSTNKYCNCDGELNAGKETKTIHNADGTTDTEEYYTKHEHTSDCYCKACDTNYCVHGHANGKHSGSCKSWGSSHIDTCTATTVCEPHEHEHCQHFNWSAYLGEDCAQDGISMRGALVTQDWVWTTDVNVPLKTDMTIYKYISKVDHVGENVNLYNGGTERRSSSMATKANNPIKVERGDKIYYTVELVNKSRFNTKVKVKDLFTNENGTLVAIYNNGKCVNTISDLTIDKDIRDSNWITVNANSTNTYTIVFRTIKDSGTYTNDIKYITTNHGTVMRWTDKHNDIGDHQGYVVNIAELRTDKHIEDSDTYKVKEYNVSIEKFIDSVSHQVSNGDYKNTMTDTGQRSRTNSAITEDSKIKNPVYVEYGDEITYKIIVYNTSEKRTMNGKENSSDPYYSPDKIYVNLEDTLPVKYSNLKVDIENVQGAGNDTHTLTLPSEGGDKFTITNLMVPGNSTRTITVKLTVEEYTKELTKDNSVKFTDTPKNINYGPSTRTKDGKYFYVKNNANSGYLSSKDRYKLNDYNARIDKYISTYNEELTKENNNNLKVTNEKNAEENIKDDVRYTYKQDEKKDHPLPVEQNETLVYSIRVSNDATETKNNTLATGTKYATQVRPTRVQDYMQEGLKYKSISAMLYNADGTVCTRYDSLGNVKVKISLASKVTENNIIYNIYNIDLNDDTIILNPGEYIVYSVTVEIDESNMYLYSLENRANLNILTNINDKIKSGKNTRIIQDTTHNENIAKQQTNSDYVKMKDLVISGKVWLDNNKNGLMDTFTGDAVDVDTIPTSNINAEVPFENITVKLYVLEPGETGEGKVYRTTKTDATGLFTFGRDEKKTWYTPDSYVVTNKSTTDSSQRIDKATNKDENGNYTKNSQFYRYYVEYLYDGVLYKSTEQYAGQNNLNNYGGFSSEDYKIDSNAKELVQRREEFNKQYEIISYDKAYDESFSNSTDLEFDKKDHNSYLKIDSQRTMTSVSFIYEHDISEIEKAVKVAKACGAGAWKSCKGKSYGMYHEDAWKVLINAGLLTEYEANNTANGRVEIQKMLDSILARAKASITADGNSQIINYLWLYNMGTDHNKPETEYLKYINLGLEEREEVDLSLTKDLYEVKTTINGEEMTYSFDQLNAERNALADRSHNAEFATTQGTYLQDFIIKKPYEMKLYESDFKYRYDDYNNLEVQSFKGRESELNVEVTYKITVDSKKIIKDYLKKDGSYTDVELDAKIHEITDFYDKAFYDVTGNTSTVEVKQKTEGVDADGNKYQTLDLTNKVIKVGEAWYYDDNDVNGTRHELTLSADTKYNTNGATSSDYHKVFITGMDDVKVAEGKDLDIYVKYVVEKVDTATLERVLSNFVDNGTVQNEGELDGIAQLNCYSVWYKDGKPASLVDCDANAGNIGLPNGNINYVENYEDTAYKTQLKIKQDDGLIREMSGMVWDDARSTQITAEDGTVQYLGDGKTDLKENADGSVSLKSGASSKLTDAKSNENVNLNYKDGATENNDLAVRNVKTEYIEVIPVGSGTNIKYYEEKINTNKWTHVQNTRTDENGKFTLSGYVPGYYIVRYTYGDGGENGCSLDLSNQEVFEKVKEAAKARLTEYNITKITYEGREVDASALIDSATSVEQLNNILSSSEAKTAIDKLQIEDVRKYLNLDTRDTLVFNGQDYKSTKYTGISDTEENYDNILKKLEEVENSDARDDEIRRLETISYSERMVNKVAEVLKGVANGVPELTPNNDKNNSIEQFKELTTNTSMYADTVRFYVKPEKIDRYTASSADDYKYKDVFDIGYSDVSTRSFSIKNLNFGLEYRPESQISLEKEISRVSVTPQGLDKPLIQVVLKTQKNADGTKTHLIDLDSDENIGLENVQFISNEYNVESGFGTISEKANKQGFEFIGTETGVLQGATVELEYKFIVTNKGEVDRISSNLDAIRFKANSAAQALESYFYKDDPTNENYAASRTAANVLKDKYGVTYDQNNHSNIIYRTKQRKAYNSSENKGYYGNYAGEFYYTGTIGQKDVISTIKFDKVLDYVDTGLVFDSKKNLGNTIKDTIWATTSSNELKNGGFIKNEIFERNYKDLFGNLGVNSDDDSLTLRDPSNIAYDTIGSVSEDADLSVETSNLVVSVADRVKDANEYAEGTDPTINVKISEFLKPQESGSVGLTVSKVLASESETKDTEYENVAEIIEFVTLTGRRTNYATTIGNADIGKNGEYDSAVFEPDTSAAEKVVLGPITGLTKINKVIRDTVDVAGKGVGIGIIIVAVVIVGFVTTTFVMKKFRKRRIK